MNCEEIQRNMSLAALQSENNKQSTIVIVRYILDRIGLPVLCAFGILGNCLNVIILTRKQLQQSMDRMEKSVHLGLVALAVSDMLFCVVALPTSFTPATMVYTEDDPFVFLYYFMYKEPFHNIFLLSSTWLTVAMATGRYMGICYPLHARGFVNLRATRISILGIFIFSVAFNLPQFWRYTLLELPCSPKCKCYMPVIASLYKNPHFMISYKVLWAILGVFVPLFMLAFCNICLIKALRESRRMRQLYRANKTKHESGHRLTPTLIAIVAMFIILVSPSEILKFVESWVTRSNSLSTFNAFMISQLVANFLVVINFTVNFILYCVLNAHFRKTVRNSLCCVPKKQDLYKSSNHTTLVMNISDCGEAIEL